MEIRNTHILVCVIHWYHRVTNGFQLVFCIKCIVRHVIEVRKSGTTCFSCQSLLLSTTVLNDIDTITMYITVFTAILLIFCHLGVAMKPYLMQTLRLSLCTAYTSTEGVNLYLKPVTGTSFNLWDTFWLKVYTLR